mmetsp:Transcript_140393/g.364990  ORF Transcript_140393/g.364990 Transcript_140393/m.364990 type:complete len:314 (+) Transcript_140393:58-999(+)
MRAHATRRARRSAVVAVICLALVPWRRLVLREKTSTNLQLSLLSFCQARSTTRSAGSCVVANDQPCCTLTKTASSLAPFPTSLAPLFSLSYPAQAGEISMEPLDDQAWLWAAAARLGLGITAAVLTSALTALRPSSQADAQSNRLVWHEKPVEDMTGLELYSVLRLRGMVFVVEQNCHYNDADGLDGHPGTTLVWADDGAGSRVAAACARITAPGVLSPNKALIGRLATREDVRGKGLGREAMRRAIAICDQRWPQSPISIVAETYLTKFYSDFGFETVGLPFLDAAVTCTYMTRQARLSNESQESQVSLLRG